MPAGRTLQQAETEGAARAIQKDLVWKKKNAKSKPGRFRLDLYALALVGGEGGGGFLCESSCFSANKSGVMRKTLQKIRANLDRRQQHA